ncbi:MAG: hypothetical protein R3A52_06620 [Polyangiales bacterium]
MPTVSARCGPVCDGASWVSCSRAMPKSVMTIRASPAMPASVIAPSIITLSGLRSRCTTPTACAAESPRHTSAATRSASPSDIFAAGRSQSATPRMNSMVR